MRKVFSYLAVAAILATGLLGNSPLGRADDSKQDERSRLLRIYSQLQNQQRSGAHFSGPGASRVNPTQPTPGTVCGAVKIWAITADSAGNPIRPVNLSMHRWGASERFYLAFASPRPLMLSVFQLYNQHPQCARTVLPDRHFPASLRPLSAGQAVKSPVLLAMDPNWSDEHICLSLQVPGMTGTVGETLLDNPPAITLIDSPTNVINSGGADEYLSFCDRLGEKIVARRIPAQARVTAVATPKVFPAWNPSASPLDFTSYNVDDWATIAVFSNNIAFLDVTLHKGQ